MTKIPKPMLAVDAAIDDVRFPVYASLKLDGIRCHIVNGVATSRSGKPIRNKYIQELFGWSEYNGLDGELIVGDVTAKDVFKQTTSGVMSYEGKPNVTFFVFDNYLIEGKFKDRIEPLYRKERDLRTDKRIAVLNQTLINTEEELKGFLSNVSNMGGEGIILRNPDSPYKHGTSCSAFSFNIP